MEQSVEVNDQEIEWKSISLDEENKKKLYSILGKLEKYHGERFRVNVALGHVLKVYEKIQNKEKYYDLI